MARAVRVAALLLGLGLCGVGSSDSRRTLERALARIQKERTELHGYMTHNATEQGNFTCVRGPLTHSCRTTMRPWLRT